MEPLEPTVVSEPRDVQQSILRGLRERCPACGEGHMFRAYLKVADACPHCHEELHHHRADDAPPYFTILIVAHIVVGGILAMEQAWQPADWVQAAVWLPATLGLSLLLLPRVKGALVALQWALRMHGFGGVEDAPMERPMPATLLGGGDRT
jgi:uncharacterized protein (DUF983 family)